MDGSKGAGEPWCKRQKKVVELQMLLRFLEQRKDDEAFRLISSLGNDQVASLLSVCQNWAMPLDQLAKEAGCIQTLCTIWKVMEPDKTHAHFLVKLDRPDLLDRWIAHGDLLDSFLENRLGDLGSATAAHCAAGEGKVHCLTILASKCPETIYVGNNLGETPAMWAAGAGHIDCLEVLQQTFALKDHGGRNVAHVAAYCGRLHVLEKIHYLGFTALLSTADSDGLMPVHWAANGGHAACLRVLARLLGAGMLQACDKNGCTPAHLAAQNGHPDCLTVYAEPEFVSISGASLFRVDRLGRSPAHWAAENGHVNCLQKLHEVYKPCMAVKVNMVLEVLKSATSSLQTDLQQHERLATRDAEGDTPAHLTYNRECFEFLKSIGGTCVFSDDICERPEILHETYQNWLQEPLLLDLRVKASWISWCITSHGSQRDLELEAIRSNPLQLDLWRSFGIQPSGNMVDGTVARQIDVRFAGERANGDGLRREWVSSVVKMIVDPHQGRALFRSRDGGRGVYPNPNSGIVDDEHLSYFALFGMLCGLALRNKEPLGVDVSVAFIKAALDIDVDVNDLKSVDPELFDRKVEYIRNADKQTLDELKLTFVDDGNEEEYMSSTSTLLKEGGSKIYVTIENREEYVRLFVRHRLVDSIEDQLSAFRNGLAVYTSCVDSMFEGTRGNGSNLLWFCGPEDLSLLVFGKPEIDVEEWKREAAYEPAFFEHTKVVDWFWSLVSKWDADTRVKLLSFVTGSKRVPAGGFASLMGYHGAPQRFTLERAEWRPGGLLPTARVCFNTLYLPEYSSSSSLKASLERAISEQEGFDEAAVAQP